MVALQILVLPAQVRILVPQPVKERKSLLFSFGHNRLNLSPAPKNGPKHAREAKKEGPERKNGPKSAREVLNIKKALKSLRDTSHRTNSAQEKE